MLNLRKKPEVLHLEPPKQERVSDDSYIILRSEEDTGYDWKVVQTGTGNIYCLTRLYKHAELVRQMLLKEWEASNG